MNAQESREIVLANSIPVTECGCWVWLGSIKKRGGYGQLKRDGINYRAHRFSYEAFREKIPNDLIVMHECDIPSCVNPDHLIAGTVLENNKDRDRKGRGVGVLNDDDVRAIRFSLSGCRILAREYGLNKRTIQDIRRRRAWCNVQ